MATLPITHPPPTPPSSPPSPPTSLAARASTTTLILLRYLDPCAIVVYLEMLMEAAKWHESQRYGCVIKSRKKNRLKERRGSLWRY